MTQKAEAVVIGAGPGGYVAAIRLGQLGKDVVLVEKENLGGVCLNVGCIPSKALIRVAKLKSRVDAAKRIGLEASDVKVDLAKAQTWKESVVIRLINGIDLLCRKNNVRVIRGEAKFNAPNVVDIATQERTERIETENTIIATGSRPIEIPGFKFDGVNVVTATEMLALREVPKNLLVVGAGVTGLEIATMFAQLGSKVVVIELLEQLLPGVIFDDEMIGILEQSIRRLGIEYHVKSKAKEFRNGKVFAILEDGKEADFPCDKVLVSVGRRPNSDQLELGKANVKTDQHGWIQVDKKLRTNVPGIYAIGDVVGPPLFAHKASKDGIVAAEVIAGMNSEADYRGVAWAIFTNPEIASVGLTETQAKEKGYDPIIGRFPFSALGRALIAGETEGFVKIVADKESDLVLGVHIIGPEASDIISEAALAIEMGATLEDLSFTIHPHPTLPEAIMEAAEAAKGKAIHIYTKK
jgi:dihydrolipoamide dehydrogenase